MRPPRTTPGVLLIVVLLAFGVLWANSSDSSEDVRAAQDSAAEERRAARELKRAERKRIQEERAAERLERTARTALKAERAKLGQPVPMDEELLEALSELGYAEWVSTDKPDVVGVTVHDRERAWEGLNLFKAASTVETFLMDMDGRVVHTWRAPGGEDGSWKIAELQPGGRMIALVEWKRLEVVDWDSTPIWSTDVSGHHDLDVDETGRIFVLTDDVREIPIGDEVVLIRDNGIAIFSPDGELLDELWLSTLFADRITERSLRRAVEHVADQPGHDHKRDQELDVFHANTLELLPRDVPGLGSKGQVLVSIRNLDLIAVLDLDEPRVVWSWGPGVLQGQHQPALLENDNLLVFDNGSERWWSRVVEVDPRRNEIVWEYHGDPVDTFYSRTRGGSEQLPNGNVLVTESNLGRVFEVTREGETVWEFMNPLVENDMRGTIYRFTRLSEEMRASLPLEDR
jgi:hypothetical protein